MMAGPLGANPMAAAAAANSNKLIEDVQKKAKEEVEKAKKDADEKSKKEADEAAEKKKAADE